MNTNRNPSIDNINAPQDSLQLISPPIIKTRARDFLPEYIPETDAPSFSTENKFFINPHKDDQNFIAAALANRIKLKISAHINHMRNYFDIYSKNGTVVITFMASSRAQNEKLYKILAYMCGRDMVDTQKLLLQRLIDDFYESEPKTQKKQSTINVKPSSIDPSTRAKKIQKIINNNEETSHFSSNSNSMRDNQNLPPIKILYNLSFYVPADGKLLDSGIFTVTRNPGDTNYDKKQLLTSLKSKIRLSLTPYGLNQFITFKNSQDSQDSFDIIFDKTLSPGLRQQLYQILAFICSQHMGQKAQEINTLVVEFQSVLDQEKTAQNNISFTQSCFSMFPENRTTNNTSNTNTTFIKKTDIKNLIN